MDVGRFQYVTANFGQLQGRRMLPLAALLIVSTAWLAGWIRLPGDEHRLAASWWFVLGLDVAIAASYVALAWYGITYGSVKQWLVASSAWPMAAALVCIPILVEIQQRLNLHFSLTMALLAAAAAARGIAHPLRRHYLAASAPLFAFVLLPALGVSASAIDILFPAALGTALAIAAMGDHRLLATTLKRTLADV